MPGARRGRPTLGRAPAQRHEWAAAHTATLCRRSWAILAHAAYPLMHVQVLPHDGPRRGGAGIDEPTALDIAGDDVTVRLAVQGVHVFEADRVLGGARSAVRLLETTTFPRRPAVELSYSITLHAVTWARSAGAPPGPRSVCGTCILGPRGQRATTVRARESAELGELDCARLRLVLVSVVLRSGYGGYEAAVSLERAGERAAGALEPLLYLYGRGARELPRLVSIAHEFT